MTAPSVPRHVLLRRLRLAWRGLRGDPVALVALAVLSLVLAVAALGPLLLPGTTEGVSLRTRLLPPLWQGGSGDHPLGTDPLGRDELRLLAVGARVSVTTGLAVVAIAGSLGTLLGMLAAYRRGWIEAAIMRTVESAVAFPGLLLALIVLALVGPSQATVVIVLTALGWMVFARIAHDRVLELRETPYIRAAETIGAHWTRIVGRHLLPNLLLPLLTVGFLEFARVVLAEASLSYLGVGIQPPHSSWGLMVAEGQRYITTAWWLVTFPGMAIAATVLSVNILGNRLRSTRTTQGPARLPPLAPVREATDPESDAMPADALVAVDGLSVDIPTDDHVVHAVRDVSLFIRPGETLGIVGESGSGKTMTALALMGLLPPGARIVAGGVRWRGALLREADKRRIRGQEITMVFQDPVASLNPLVPIGRQIEEVLRRSGQMGREAARERAVSLLDRVGIPNPRSRLRQFPWELSGGMCQRVMLAIALGPNPDLIIADEPTTALDVTIQAQLLELLKELQSEFGMAIALITHDLGVVAGMCERLVVMKDGSVVEEGPSRQVFYRPAASYTADLLAATPRLDRPSVRS